MLHDRQTMEVVSYAMVIHRPHLSIICLNNNTDGPPWAMVFILLKICLDTFIGIFPERHAQLLGLSIVQGTFSV